MSSSENTQKSFRLPSALVTKLSQLAKTGYITETAVICRLIDAEYDAQLKAGKVKPIRDARVQYRIGHQGHVVHESEWFYWHVGREGQLVWGKWPEIPHQARGDDPGVSQVDVEDWADPAGGNWPPPVHAAHRDDISARRAQYAQDRNLFQVGADPETGEPLYAERTNAPRAPMIPMDAAAIQAELDEALGGAS